MAIKGSLREASLPDVLQLLALGQKTGCLSIADRSNFGYIFFDRGRICYASIVNRRDRLGDILAKHEKITQDQLDTAVARQTRERDPLAKDQHPANHHQVAGAVHPQPGGIDSGNAFALGRGHHERRRMKSRLSLRACSFPR